MRALTHDESMQGILAWATRSDMGAPAPMPDTYTKDEQDRVRRECWTCIHARSIVGDAHLACASPDEQMRMSEHGIARGWGAYPMNFDPVWKTRLCRFHTTATAETKENQPCE